MRYCAIFRGRVGGEFRDKVEFFSKTSWDEAVEAVKEVWAQLVGGGQVQWKDVVLIQVTRNAIYCLSESQDTSEPMTLEEQLLEAKDQIAALESELAEARAQNREGNENHG